MEAMVISMGGSVLFSDEIKNSYFQDFTKLIQKTSKKCKIYLVVGGGKTARTYIKLGRNLKLNETQLDEIGIEITRVNAKTLTNIIKDSNKKIPHTTDEAIRINTPIVIMGGTTPGHSTDMVAAELAEKTNASKFIIATNVDGVYDKDPNKYSDAKQIKELTVQQLIDEQGTDWESAGKNVVIDGPALKIMKRLEISTYVLNGKKLDQLEKALNNQPFFGTELKE